MANGTYLNRLAAQPPIRFRPRLLLLAAFLASAPLYPPNSYLMLRFAPNVSPAGDFLFAMLLSCFATALAILLFSDRHRLRLDVRRSLGGDLDSARSRIP